MTQSLPLTYSLPGTSTLLWPPLLGQKAAQWADVFALVRQHETLWDTWGPSKTLDQYTLDEIWASYISGEPSLNKDGVQTGVKPPLRLVEQYFQATWRKGKDVTVSVLTILYVTYVVFAKRFLSIVPRFPRRGKGIAKSPSGLICGRRPSLCLRASS